MRDGNLNVLLGLGELSAYMQHLVYIISETIYPFWKIWTTVDMVIFPLEICFFSGVTSWGSKCLLTNPFDSSSPVRTSNRFWVYIKSINEIKCTKNDYIMPKSQRKETWNFKIPGGIKIYEVDGVIKHKLNVLIFPKYFTKKKTAKLRNHAFIYHWLQFPDCGGSLDSYQHREEKWNMAWILSIRRNKCHNTSKPRKAARRSVSIWMGTEREER